QIAAHDEAGRLWVITIEGVVAWREADTWRTLPADAFQGDTARRLFPGGAGGGVLVAAESLWRVAAGSASARLVEVPRVGEAVPRSDGGTAGLASQGEIILLSATGTVDTLVPVSAIPGTRAISLVERNGTLWAATDRYLIAAE